MHVHQKYVINTPEAELIIFQKTKDAKSLPQPCKQQAFSEDFFYSFDAMNFNTLS